MKGRGQGKKKHDVEAGKSDAAIFSRPSELPGGKAVAVWLGLVVVLVVLVVLVVQVEFVSLSLLSLVLMLLLLQ